MAKKIRAEDHSWFLLDKIGSGDAGEVWRVEAENSKQAAVLKRPVQNVSGGTILRQASQIEAEGQILADLDGIDARRNNTTIHTPLLIDTSISGTSGTTGLFIISEEVSGIAISGLLDQLRQGQSTFSQVLSLKVLAATFHLLRQVHAKGILWNDVKLDHIFWDEEASKMSFIDWGNGLRFDPDAPDERINPSLDFQHLIDEGRQLLTQISPDLIKDLAWPISATGLSDLDIFHLQMRVEYLENHLTMRVIEYQLLFKKYLQSADDNTGMQTVLELKKALEGLGVQVETDDILKNAQLLFIQFLEKNEADNANELCQLLEENLALPAHWQLAIYFFRALKQSKVEELPKLIEPCLNEQWPESLWQFHAGFRTHFSAENASVAIVSMRNLANNLKDTPLIIRDMLPGIQKDLQQNIARLKGDNTLNPELINQLQGFEAQLSSIQTSWDILPEGETLGEKILKTRELLATLASMGLGIPVKLQPSLTTLLTKIREVYRAWSEAELDLAQKLLKELFLLDPNLDYLHPLAEEIQKTADWVEALKDGPHAEQSVNAFGAQMLESLPKAHHKLGTPGWLNAFYGICQAIHTCQDLNLLRAELQQVSMPFDWIDYSALKLEFQTPAQAITQFNEMQNEALSAFYKALALKNDAQEELAALKNQLLTYHFLYAKLHEQFQQAWALNPPKDDNIDISDFPPADQSRVAEAFKTLAFIKTMRESTQARSVRLVNQSPKTTLNWVQIEEIQTASRQWQETILPMLGRIKQKEWSLSPSVEPRQSLYPDLVSSLRQLTKLSQAWRNVEHQGIFPERLSEMSAQIELAQKHFYNFWQTLETSPIAVNRWLCMVNQPVLSEINQSLLLIMRQLQSVSRALDVLNTPQMARTRLALNSAGELMFTLVQLNELILPPSRDFNLYRHWRQQYLDLIEEGNVGKIRENIQSIESIHPLLPWLDELLRRDTDYFKVPEWQRW